MSEAAPPLDSMAPSPPVLNAVEIRNLIREELDRNNTYLTFAQNQIDKDRTFYKYLFTLTGTLISALVIVGVSFTIIP
jgi:hypothetical protein